MHTKNPSNHSHLRYKNCLMVLSITPPNFRLMFETHKEWLCRFSDLIQGFYGPLRSSMARKHKKWLSMVILNMDLLHPTKSQAHIPTLRNQSRNTIRDERTDRLTNEKWQHLSAPMATKGRNRCWMSISCSTRSTFIIINYVLLRC